MSPHYKAFIVVFALSLAVLFFFRPAFAQVVGARRYNTWAILWLGYATLAFVISNYC